MGFPPRSTLLTAGSDEICACRGPLYFSPTQPSRAGTVTPHRGAPGATEGGSAPCDFTYLWSLFLFH